MAHLDAASAIDLPRTRADGATGWTRPTTRIRRAGVFLFTFAVEAFLVVGFILVILAPGADGRHASGPDRPPVPVTATHRP
jgi:hypothetical protein